MEINRGKSSKTKGKTDFLQEIRPVTTQQHSYPNNNAIIDKLKSYNFSNILLTYVY